MVLMLVLHKNEEKIMCSGAQKADTRRVSRRIPRHPAIAWWNLCSGKRHPQSDARWIILCHLMSRTRGSATWAARPTPSSRLPIRAAKCSLSACGPTQRTHLVLGPHPLTSSLHPQLEEASGRREPLPKSLPEKPTGCRARVRAPRPNKQCLIHAGMNSRPTPQLCSPWRGTQDEVLQERLLSLSNCRPFFLLTRNEMPCALIVTKIDGGFACDNAPGVAPSQVPRASPGRSAVIGRGRAWGSCCGKRPGKPGGNGQWNFGKAGVGRSPQITTLRWKRAAHTRKWHSTSSRGAASCSRLSSLWVAPPATRAGPSQPCGSASLVGCKSDRAEESAAALRGARAAAPGNALPPACVCALPACVCARARALGPTGPLILCAQRWASLARRGAAPWAPVVAWSSWPGRQPGFCHVSVPEVERERKTRYIPSPTAILYFIPNLIFIPTFYSRSVSTFSVAFLCYSSFCPFFFVFRVFFPSFPPTSLIIVCIWESWRSMILSLFLNASFSSMQWFCRWGTVSGSPRRSCRRSDSCTMCNWFYGKSDVKYGAYFLLGKKFLKSVFLPIFGMFFFSDKIFG